MMTGFAAVLPAELAESAPLKVTTVEADAGATPTSAVRASAAADATAISFLDI
jgi:hypothetical protein